MNHAELMKRLAFGPYHETPDEARGRRVFRWVLSGGKL